jgi:insulin-like growth factor-binding protein complex acid labile subunit
MKFLLFNILLVAIIQHASSIGINQSLLIQKYGFNIDSVVIDLSERSIDTIDINTFIGFTKLEKLYLEENKIKQLENGLFNHLESLKEVWLESNIIISIDKNVFVGLNNLEKVCLKDNPISIMFPTNIKPLCDTNPMCTIKINEKCIKDIPSKKKIY